MIKSKRFPNSATQLGLLSFGIITLAILPILIKNKGSLFLVGDYMTQQIPFITECRRQFLTGTPFWSSNTFLGANTLGTYSFYVYGSPFFWPLLLVPEKYLTIGISTMFILKHVVAALTSYKYLKYMVRTNHLAIVGALCYTFSSFTIDSTYYYHFIDVISFFPLILLFTEKVLIDKRKGSVGLAFAAALNAVTNYYFFVSSSIFLLLYLFFRIKFNENYNWKDALRCLVFYAAGGLMSAIVLLPSAFALLETSKTSDSFSKLFLAALGCIPQVIKILKGIVLPSEGILHSATGLTIAPYSSNCAFLPFFGALFLFTAFRNKNNKWDYRFVKFLFILSLVPFGNGLFSLFTNLNYSRWWYAFVLMSVLASIHVLEQFKDDPLHAREQYKKSAKTILKVSLWVTLPLLVIKILLAYVLKDFLIRTLSESLNQTLDGFGVYDGLSTDTFRYMAVLLVLTAITYFPLYFSIKKGWIYSAKIIIPVVGVICLLNYGIYLTNEVHLFHSENDQILTSSYAADERVEYSSRTALYKKPAYANVSMLVNQPSIYTFHSFKSTATSSFCRIAGYHITTAPTTHVCYTTPAIQTVLSVENLTKADGTTKKAPYYSGFGYEYKYYVLDTLAFTQDEQTNNQRIETMCYACYVDEETAADLADVLEPLPEKANISWKKASSTDRQTACTDFKMNSAGFSATSTGEHTRLIYFSVPHDNGWSATINGKTTKIYTVNGGMMAIVVPKGASDIQFNFYPPGLKAGMIISLLSVLSVSVYGVIVFVKKKKA